MSMFLKKDTNIYETAKEIKNTAKQLIIYFLNLFLKFF